MRSIYLFLCLIECAYGWYGAGCKQLCPGHCRNNVTCNQYTGVCDEGCADGWNGSFCNRSNFFFSNDIHFVAVHLKEYVG